MTVPLNSCYSWINKQIILAVFGTWLLNYSFDTPSKIFDLALWLSCYKRVFWPVMRNIVLCKLYDSVFIYTYFIDLYNVLLHPLYQKLNSILPTVKYTDFSHSRDMYKFLYKYKDKGFCGQSVLMDVVFVSQLSTNAGISVWHELCGLRQFALSWTPNWSTRKSRLVFHQVANLELTQFPIP